MFWVLFFLLLVIAILVITTKYSWEENFKSMLISHICALGFLLLLTFVVAPYTLGYGRVPFVADEFTHWLRVGEVYQLIASHADGADAILLVREKDSQYYYAIRVNSGKVGLREPPYFFTLVNGGQLVEVK